MQIRPITPGDRLALKEFASRIPPEDIVFTDRSLMSDIAVASWTQAVPAKPLIAVDEPEGVLGIVTVVPGVSWSNHVGDIRVVVLPAARSRGVGRALAEGGLDLAQSLDLAKVMIEIMATNAGGLSMFRALGFSEEARLHAQVRDGLGAYQDLVILSRWLQPQPSGAADTG
jgi:GNAT superfamily N-acetyltransferase